MCLHQIFRVVNCRPSNLHLKISDIKERSNGDTEGFGVTFIKGADGVGPQWKVPNLHSPQLNSNEERSDEGIEGFNPQPRSLNLKAWSSEGAISYAFIRLLDFKDTDSSCV